jgi:hypothetical protein
LILGAKDFFMTQPKSAVKKISILLDEVIHRHQPSSPAAASHCPFTQTLPSTFVVVAVVRAVAVVVAVAVAVAVVVAVASGVVL